MRPPLPVLLLAASAAYAADAEQPAPLLARASSHLSRVHALARRHSAGLAHDLRLAFGGILPARAAHAPPERRGQTVLDAGHKLYCTVPREADGGGPLNPAGPNGVTSPAGPGATGAHTKPTPTQGSAGATGTGTQAAPSSTSSWKVKQSYTGNDFFNEWDFFTGGDPTHGTVNFVDADTAKASNLSYVSSSGTFIMAMDTTPKVASLRNSVRITTKAVYNGGLLIMDAAHMPTGCGTWPAFWSNGPNWPAGGEIDIVEGISTYSANQATIHTNPGCSIPSTSASALGITGTLVAQTDCSAADTGNQGCGMRSASNVSFGAAFNGNGGGVYAMRWDDSGIAIWFFEPSAVPHDVTAGSPTPESWGLPMAHWPSTDCTPGNFFHDHSAIFDTTLCGDWAGGAWGSSGLPGQSTSCAASTGVQDCVSYVLANGEALAEAYWEVRSVKLYQTN